MCDIGFHSLHVYAYHSVPECLWLCVCISDSIMYMQVDFGVICRTLCGWNTKLPLITGKFILNAQIWSNKNMNRVQLDRLFKRNWISKTTPTHRVDGNMSTFRVPGIRFPTETRTKKATGVYWTWHTQKKCFIVLILCFGDRVLISFVLLEPKWSNNNNNIQIAHQIFKWQSIYWFIILALSLSFALIVLPKLIDLKTIPRNEPSIRMSVAFFFVLLTDFG